MLFAINATLSSLTPLSGFIGNNTEHYPQLVTWCEISLSLLSLCLILYIWKQFRASQCFYLDTSYVFWIIVLHQYNMYVYHIQYHECSKKLCQGPRCSQLIPGYLEIYRTEMFILNTFPIVWLPIAIKWKLVFYETIGKKMFSPWVAIAKKFYVAND